jgi:glucokinase
VICAAQVRIGIDIGGTKTEAVLLDPEGVVHTTLRVPTQLGPEGVLRTVDNVLEALGTRVGHPVVGDAVVGCGVAGAVDGSGRVVHGLNLGLTDFDLASVLSAQLGRPVAVENDVSAAALGALSVLDLDPAGSIVYLNIGTGLKAGVIAQGRIWRGSLGAAGEIGHISVDPDGPRCVCGQRGCIEAFASGTALRRSWPHRSSEPILEVSARAEAGDVVAKEIVERVAFGVASALRVLALTFDIDSIALGGGLVRGGWITRCRAMLVQWEAESAFLASLALERRLSVLPPDRPYAAIGAALAASPAPVTTHPIHP